jgi:ATP-dependent Clp protease ATP-binding subunit ClpA
MPQVEITNTERAQIVLERTANYAVKFRHEFIMPEHLLYALLDNSTFTFVLSLYGDDEKCTTELESKLKDIESLPDTVDIGQYPPTLSAQMTQLLDDACHQVVCSSAEQLDITHLVVGLLQLKDNWAAYLLESTIGQGKMADFLTEIINFFDSKLLKEDLPSVPTADADGDYFKDSQHLDDDYYFNDDDETDGDEMARPSSWSKLVTLMNDHVADRNPLIGREQELERTIQVLCRREKNNPLHVGEPGVGKTALVWGLVARIKEGRVPERLKGSHVFMLDIGTLLAGTQYRGDFEKRVKYIMEGIANEGYNNIVYIDEIHNLVGAGASGDSAMDASNMLKPYLESGELRFIGSTTYDEYNRYFAKSKGLVRRFLQIDILEPSIEETIHIVQQLRPKYEEFHGVSYDDEALRFAVEASAKFVNDRFLPDKALDLIDEAGAALEILGNKATVTRAIIADVLSKTCKVEALAMKDDDNERLAKLTPQLASQIYGQDEAIRQVVEAVQLSKAGLTDDDKPIASLLFVGPTGVGKTEVARVLAREMGIELVRFDMSEYTEKHTVAKLIGSPAGYVGYEDGGLLTDAIRRAPNCVLLLDEIEKAHSDIYNILLQVMDYARLTDNKGRRADFRNVVLIMTSNAGAQYAGQAAIGFQGGTSRGEAMMRQVKKTFKPEFINRLSATVVFNDMDRHMATLILRKKLKELEKKLNAKGVTMQMTDAAFDRLLNEGFTREYGAREMDRVIAQRLKPLLMHEILFGKLKNGGNVTINSNDDGLSIG